MVHDVDLSDESPTGPQESLLGSKQTVHEKSCELESKNSTADAWEPFSGDLQVLIPEREEKNSPEVTRRRRKLPEIPKNPSRRCKISSFFNKKNGYRHQLET